MKQLRRATGTCGALRWAVFRRKGSRTNLTAPLDCWREVAHFKTAVADAEAVREPIEPFTSELDIIRSDTLPRCDETPITGVFEFCYRRPMNVSFSLKAPSVIVPLRSFSYRVKVDTPAR